VSANAVTTGFVPELHLTICLKAIDTFRPTGAPNTVLQLTAARARSVVFWEADRQRARGN